MVEVTKEQVWKEEARKAYQDQQSQDNEGGCREPIGFVQGYLAAKKSDFEEIQKARDDIEFWKNEYVSHSESMCKCQQELQKTRERLEIAEKVIEIYSNPESDEWISHKKELHGVKIGVYKDVYSLSSFAKQYFKDKDKDKQGE